VVFVLALVVTGTAALTFGTNAVAHPEGSSPLASLPRPDVSGATVTFSPPSGPVGSDVVLQGSSFIGIGENITAWFNGTAESCNEGVVNVSMSGAFTCTIVVPPSPAGAFYVIGANTTSDGLVNATTNFTVVASIATLPTSGPVGTSLTVTGTGMAPLTTVTVTWDVTHILCTPASDADGSFTCAAVVPPSPLGSNDVSASSGAGYSAGPITFDVTTSFSLSVSDGPPGTTTTLLGTGFDISDTYDFCLQSSSAPCSIPAGSFVPDSNGSIPSGTTLTVSVAEPAGDYFVDVSTSGTFVISAPFQVTLVTLGLSPTSGTVGTTITLSGDGYAPETTYDYCYQATSASCLSDAVSFNTGLTDAIPSGTTVVATVSTNGVHNVTVYLSGSLLVSDGFTVEAALALSPVSGPVGTSVTATGTGLDASAPFVLTLASASIHCSNANTTALGDAACTFDVPATPEGSATAVLSEGSLAPSAAYTVTSSFAASPSTGPVGTSVEWLGNGFPASTAFSVRWNATSSGTLCTGTSTSDGAMGCTASVPPAPSGTYNVDATATGTSVSTHWVVVPALRVNPTAGPIGTAAVVTGTGFDADVPYALTWDTSTDLCSSGSTLGDGSFSCAFTVPTASGGPNTLAAREGSNFASTTFTIGAALSISDSTGFVGTEETVTGVGFDPSAAYDLYWDLSIRLCNGTTSSGGGFGCTFDVPAATAGIHNLTAFEGAYAPVVTYLVAPALALSESQGPPGTTVNATGTGFGGSSTYLVSWNGISLCSGTTDPTGSFACSFVFPDAPGGSGAVSAVTGSNEAAAAYTVIALLGQSANSGAVGLAVLAHGAGFAASTNVTLYWNSSFPLCSGASSSNGSFACGFTVPPAPGGAHVLDAVQGSTSVTSTFTVLPSVTVDPTTAAVGALVQINGSGFAADEHAVVLWNATLTLCNPVTNTNGGFTCTFLVPSSVAGPIAISGEQGTYATSVYFTVQPGPPAPAPPSGAPSIPWWAIVFGAVVVGLVLVGLIFYELGAGRRRGRRPPSRSSDDAPVQPWQGAPAGAVAPSTPMGPSSPPGSPPPAGGSGTIAVASGATAAGAGEPEDIDALIARLDRMSQQMFKKSPKELSNEEPEADESSPPP